MDLGLGREVLAAETFFLKTQISGRPVIVVLFAPLCLADRVHARNALHFPRVGG